MRWFLSRIPRESRFAAVILGVALLQVGILAWLGLSSVDERLSERRGELRDRTRQTVAHWVVGVARERLAALENTARLALRRASGAPEKRVRVAVFAVEELAGTRVFPQGFLVDQTGRIWHWRRPPLAAPPTRVDEEARRELERLLELEWQQPEAALAGAQALVDRIEARPEHEQDAVVAALALRIAWRAALNPAREPGPDPSFALKLAFRVLDRYAALRDDRDPAVADTEPFGPIAAALVCRLLLDAADGSREHGDDFMEAILDRRHLAQGLGDQLSPATRAGERKACDELRDRAYVLVRPEERRYLDEELEVCDAIDGALAVVRALPQSRIRKLLVTGAAGRVRTTDGSRMASVLPLAAGGGGNGGGALAVVLVSDPTALEEYAVAPARRPIDLPSGIGVLVRDAENRTLWGDPEQPSFIEKVPFGDVAPGLWAGATLEDPAALEREIRGERAYWLWVLAGAGLAVVAASLLAVRAVMREVRLARMKSDFVSNLSHELRTPLTSLRMFVETLLEGRVRDEEERRECLEVVHRETERLSGMVDRILQFAAFSRGRAPIDLKSADVGEVTGRAVEVFRSRAAAAGAELEFRVEPDLPEAIVDRDAIIQVVLNLLDNAVKYGGDDGGRILVAVRGAGPRAVIEVADDGPGVPERERERVFEEFYRGDDSLSQRVQGTGIGLALSRRIVLAHGGRISLERSRELGGALFRVTLPAAETGRRLAMAAREGR